MVVAIETRGIDGSRLLAVAAPSPAGAGQRPERQQRPATPLGAVQVQNHFSPSSTAGPEAAPTS
jgi:hypothetical protein